MKNRSGEKIKLASIDELLGVVNEESAMEIEISKIHPFKNHPFKVLDDEKMQDLVESVKINGVLTPVLLRMDENEDYEMVSGHRRMHAAQLAGLTTIPAIVRELSDDDAIVAMVDANIQREELLPSEKAFAYFLLRNVMGNSNAATVMVLLMLPAFLFAMYEKDGMHLEDVLMHMIRVKFLRPPVRKYETENYYETDPEQIRQSPDAGKTKGGKTVAKKEK